MEKFCSNCGQKLENEAKFCGNCGAIQPEIEQNNSDENLEGHSLSATETKQTEHTSGVVNEPEEQVLTQETKTEEKTVQTEKRPNLSTFITPKTSNPNKKRKIVVGIGVVLAVIVIGGVYTYVQAQPKSVIGDVKVDFSGYNHQGQAQLSGEYQQKINEIIAKKSSGLKTLAYEADTRVQLSQTSQLSNGEKIILSVRTSLKDNPIKSESKTVIVKNLKKSTTYTADDVLKTSNVDFSGFNHFGSVKYDDSVFTTNDNTTNLSNGDEISLSLTQDYINQQEENGKVLSGTSRTTITIKGLDDSPKISNLADFLKQEDAVVNNDNKDSTSEFFKEDYTVTRQDSYFIGEDVNGGNNLFDDSSDSADGSFSILTIYKINDKTDYDNTTTYKIYGYGGLQLSGTTINVSSLTDSQKYSDFESFNTLEDAINAIKSDYPSLVKVN